MARKIIIYAVFAVIAVNAAIIALVLAGGAGPAPRPLPNPNGYDDFVKAGQMVTGYSGNYTNMSREELAALVAANSEALRLIRVGLSRGCRVPVDYSVDYNANTNNIFVSMSFRELAWMLCAEGRLAELDGRTNVAANIYLDGIRFGQEQSRGGVILSKLVGIACENIAMSPLLTLTNSLDAAKCGEIEQALQTIDAGEEPIEETFQNEKLWSWKTYGLRGQIERLMTYKTLRQTDALFIAKVQKTQLRRSRMIIDFAARAYELEKGKPPQSAADLVPEYLKAIPKDPVTGKEMGLRP